jgi:alkylation response protein AidB-like acyl-CoA dehydrogenase
VLVGQHGRQIGLWAIQLHGAMGMTDECRVGHYAKRLMVIGQLFGDATWHLGRMASVRA